jgi:hypothetical protein
MDGTPRRRIFVFGSNLAGRHGKGAALFAKQRHGAKQGQGIGLQSDSYGIPTKDEQIKTLPLREVSRHVATFLAFATEHPEWDFDITPVGCGLAGFKRSEIEPLFEDRGPNCHFTESWNDHKN